MSIGPKPCLMGGKRDRIIPSLILCSHSIVETSPEHEAFRMPLVPQIIKPVNNSNHFKAYSMLASYMSAQLSIFSSYIRTQYNI